MYQGSEKSVSSIQSACTRYLPQSNKQASLVFQIALFLYIFGGPDETPYHLLWARPYKCLIIDAMDSHTSLENVQFEANDTTQLCNQLCGVRDVFSRHVRRITALHSEKTTKSRIQFMELDSYGSPSK